MSKKDIDEQIREEKERILRDVVELTPASKLDEKSSIRWKPRFSQDAFVPEGQKRLRPLDTQTYYDLQLSRGASRPTGNGLDWEFSSPEEGVTNRLEQNRGRLDHLNKYTAINSHMRMLEIGTRNAQWLYFLAQLGFNNTVGMDCVHMNVLWCQKNGFDVVEADAHQVAQFFDSASFDLVVAYHVLEHCYDPELVIQQVLALLKNDGIFHVEIPIAGYDPQTAHVYSFDSGEMSTLLTGNGFRLVHTEIIDSAERIIARKTPRQ
jgi:SAM-dependent methyltransferase